jgi:ATP-binding cassette, subfamily B, bacterial MsbA
VTPLRRLLGYGRPYRGLLARAFVCMALLGVTTGAYAWLTGPALRFLLTGGSDGLGLAARVFPVLRDVDRDRALWAFPAVVIAIGAIKAVGYLGQFYWSGLFGQRVVAAIRRDLFARLCALSPSQLSRQLSGDLLSRFSADVAAVEVAATYTVAAYARDGLQIAVLIAVALALEWKLALAMLAIVPLAAWPVSRLTRRLLDKTRRGQQQLGAIAAQVPDGLGGQRTIQALGGQGAEWGRLDGHAA